MDIEHRQEQARIEQERKHGLEMLDMRRREAAQAQSFEREARSVELAQAREKVAHYSADYAHMPSVHLALKPPGRMAVPAKAQRRFYAPTVKDENAKAQTADATPSQATQEGSETPQETLTDAFTAATQYDYSDTSAEGRDPGEEQSQDRSRRR